MKLNRLKFRYHITGSAPWKPIRVFDDGNKVYIQFRSGLIQGEIKVDPERMELRARTKSITGISRKILFGGIAVLVFLVAGAVLLALDPPGWNKGAQTELYQPIRTTKPDGLSDLPATYDNIPTLGPPNPGDIGKSLSRLETDLGILPASDNPAPSFVPDPEADFCGPNVFDLPDCNLRRSNPACFSM